MATKCRAASVAGALCESSWRWRGLRMAFMSTISWGTKAAIGFWKYCKYLIIKRSRVMLPSSCLLYFVFELVMFHWRYASCIQCRTGCLWLAGRANLSESQQHQSNWQETPCSSVIQACSCSGYLLLFDCVGCCSRNFPLHLESIVGNLPLSTSEVILWQLRVSPKLSLCQAFIGSKAMIFLVGMIDLTEGIRPYPLYQIELMACDDFKWNHLGIQSHSRKTVN